jgi:hypothetical protein
MFAMPGLRAFSLAAKRGSEGVSCDGQGVFVGGVPLLQPPDAGNPCWRVRPISELSKELTARYRLPIDLASKAGGLALMATALNRGDLAMAAIAAVQMQIPDPPPWTSTTESDERIARRVAELWRSGLLKADSDWDAKHPRTGTPPNPGWFAPVPKEPQVPTERLPSTAAVEGPCQFVGFVGTLCLYHCGGSFFITTPGPICLSRVFPTFPGAKQWGDHPMLGE